MLCLKGQRNCIVEITVKIQSKGLNLKFYERKFSHLTWLNKKKHTIKWKWINIKFIWRYCKKRAKSQRKNSSFNTNMDKQHIMIILTFMTTFKSSYIKNLLKKEKLNYRLRGTGANKCYLSGDRTESERVRERKWRRQSSIALTNDRDIPITTRFVENWWLRTTLICKSCVFFL